MSKDISVEIRSLVKSFTSKGNTVRAVDDVSLSIGADEFICLLGPSGCGKTTTLRCLAGLERPDSGIITIGGKVVFDSSSRRYVPTEKRGLGMVFQSYAIWPHMSVFENVAYPLRRITTLSRDQVRMRVRSILETVDCAQLETRHPGELSGGQQQRIALARALVYEPTVLLFDEPLSNLDAKLRERMRFELRLIQERVGFTAIYVTHDQEEALTLSDRIAVMSNGKIRQIASPDEVYERPVDGFVADFIGSTNVLPVVTGSKVVGSAAQTVIGQVGFGSRAPDPADAQEPLQVVVRPERVHLLPDSDGNGDNVFRGVVMGRAYRGEAFVYTLRCNDVQIRAIDYSKHRLEIGDKAIFHLPIDNCRLVPGNGGHTPKELSR